MPDGKWVSKANLQTFWQMIRSKVLPTMVGDTVTTWLTEHVDPVGSAVVVDDTLTIAGAAADAKKTGDEISGLKEDFESYSGFKRIQMTAGAFIKTNIAAGETVDTTPVSSSSTEYAIMPCSPGDVFLITARGTQPATAVSFLDSNDKVITRAEESRTYDRILMSAPANSVKIIINNYTVDGVARTSYKGNQNGFFDAADDITVLDGYYINYNNGSTKAFSSMGVTNYIPVEPNQKYYIGFPRFFENSCIGIYNARRQFIGEYGHGMADSGVIITTPETAAYIRITVRKSMIPTVGRLVDEKTLFDEVNKTKENVGTRNFTGNPLHIEETGAAILSATISGADENTTVTACGKNIFDIPESKVVTKNGVTFTYDADEKSIRVQSDGATANTVSGESGTLGDATFVYDFKFRFKTGRYVTFTSNCSEFIDYLPQVYMQFISQGDARYYDENGYGYTRWCAPGFEYCVRIVVRKGWSGDLTFHPQIEINSYPTPFEKYHGLTVAGTIVALRDLNSYTELTNVFTNDDSTLSVTVSNESDSEKLAEAFETSKDSLLLVPYISKAFSKIDEIGAHICFIDDDTSSLALVERYHDLFDGTDAVGNYAVIAKRLEDQAGLYAKLQDYEIEGFGMLYHCYDQYSEGPGNTTYFQPENRNIIECQRNVLMGLRLFEQYPFANYKYWVTPYGVNDADIQSIAKKYGFNCMMSTGNNGIVSRSNADRWNIPRCGFATKVDNTTFLKQMLDVTIQTKGMMIVTTHVNSWGSGTTYDERFVDFLNYVLNHNGVKVVSLPEAFETRKALFELNSLT